MNKDNNTDAHQKITLSQSQKNKLTPEEELCFSLCLDEYLRTLVLLRQYDEQKIDESDIAVENPTEHKIKTDAADLIVERLKLHLAERGENVRNFGVARDDGVGKVLMNIYQTWDGKELYPDLEGKAAHLFYFLIKDHLFIDGNKRIASFLLLWFMALNDMLFMGLRDRTIAYNGIYALAVFVAESSPKDKEIVVKLIHNIIMSHNKALPE